MSSIVLSGDTSGSVTLTVPSVAGTNTVTVPSATGTVMVSGNMPAFSAYKSSNQSVTSGVVTKVTFDTEEFDTNNNFASSRFTPTVAGYYQINSMINSYDASSGGSYSACYIFKNGSRYQDGTFILTVGKGVVNSLVYLNGSTDYIEIYVNIGAVSAAVYGTTLGSGQTWVNGSLVRAA
jgi:hypothetical protein